MILEDKFYKSNTNRLQIYRKKTLHITHVYEKLDENTTTTTTTNCLNKQINKRSIMKELL